MKTTIRGLLTFAAVTLALPSFAQNSAREYNLQIERQPLASALTEFSKQTGLQIGYFPETLSQNIYIGPLSGRYTVDAAIAQLLLPSGLSFERLNERTIAVTGSELTKSQSHRSSTMERKTVHDDNSAPSFVRLAHLRLAEGPVTEENFQENRTVENARGSGRRSPFTLEEIIVTAQKREERLQDVPMSISVLTGDYLDRSTVEDVTEALTRVPGISVGTSALVGFSQFPVRGVSTATADSGSSPTAFYLDSVPFGFASDGFSPDADAYDLQRVEVLKGPQGTLYGANALNGVVRVLTKDANLDEFELKARGLTSSTKIGGENYRADATVNVPIIEGKVAARAALGYQDLSGWIDRPNNKDANDAERSTMRLKVNAQPSEALSLGLSAWRSRADYGAPSTGFDPGHNSKSEGEPTSSDYDVYGLKIGYDFPSLSLTSTTSYLDYSTDYVLQLGAALPGYLDATTFAQEIYLASRQEGSWRWTAGGMYRDSEDIDSIEIPGLADCCGFVAPLTLRNVSKSYAVFGELTRLFLDGKWEFTAGLRYFEDDLAQFEDSRFTGEPPEELINVDDTFSATTPRFVLTWHPSEQMTVYGSYAEGFRSGWHQNPSVLLVAPYPPIEPDSLTNYELGAKGSLWGGRLNFETALYYIDWQDVQQVLNVQIGVDQDGNPIYQGAGVNGESASGIGFDFGVTTRPIDALELGLSFSRNDLTMDADVFTVVGGNPVLLFAKGDRINGSGGYAVSASADYVFPLGSTGFEGRFSASANYTAPQQIRNLVGDEVLVVTSESWLIARTSVSIRTPEHWIATLFVDNVNDEKTAVTGNDLILQTRPRTIGVQFEYQF